MESLCFHFCMGLRVLAQLSDLHSQSLDSLGKCFYPLSHLSKCWLFLIWLCLLTKLNFVVDRCVLEKTVFIVFTTVHAIRHPGVGSRNALASLNQSSGFWWWILSQRGLLGFWEWVFPATRACEWECPQECDVLLPLCGPQDAVTHCSEWSIMGLCVLKERFEDLLVLILCVWMFTICLCTTGVTGAHRGHKKAQDSPRTGVNRESLAFVWVLGTKDGSSARAVRTINYWAIPPAPHSCPYMERAHYLHCSWGENHKIPRVAEEASALLGRTEKGEGNK